MEKNKDLCLAFNIILSVVNSHTIFLFKFKKLVRNFFNFKIRLIL